MRTAKTCRPAALQPSKHLSVWVLAVNLVLVFSTKAKRNTVLNSMSVLYTWKQVRFRACAVDASDPRNRILPDLVSSSPFPSPPLFFVLEPPKRDLGTRSQNLKWLNRYIRIRFPSVVAASTEQKAAFHPCLHCLQTWVGLECLQNDLMPNYVNALSLKSTGILHWWVI